MNNDNKKIIQETGRWLRVGFMTISVLGPVINTVSSRLRERAKVLREEAAKRSSGAYTQSQERLTTAGTSLAESLNELKEHPYSQGLLKRGSSLTENLVDRGSKLSQVVAKRSEQAGRDLAERSSKATQVVTDRSDVLQELVERSEKASQELAKRGEQVSKEIAKRGAKVSKEVTKRSQKAAKEVKKRSQKAQRELAKRTQELTQPNSRQNSPLLAVLSFSMGLTAAGVAAYLLIKKRLQQNQQDSQQARLSLNGSLNGTSKSTTNGDIYSISQPSLATKTTEAPEVAAPTLTFTESILVEPEVEDDLPATEKMPAVASPSLAELSAVEEPVAIAPTEAVSTPESGIASDTQTDAVTTGQKTPAASIQDATFLGVVSTKYYYPVETPLNELHSTGDVALEVVYFATEDEAKAQGYTIAQ